MVDSDDEVIESTPEPPKGQKKRKGQILSSDSEDDTKKPSKGSKKKIAKKDSKVKEEKPKLKPIDLDSINVPIQQTKVEYVPSSNDDDWALTSLVNKGQKKKESSKKKKPVETGKFLIFKMLIKGVIILHKVYTRIRSLKKPWKTWIKIVMTQFYWKIWMFWIKH